MHEDFQAFPTTIGLLEFSRHLKKTYKEISREFITTFRFKHIKSYKESKRGKDVAPTFTIKFSMMNQCFVMSLEEFCNAVCVENTGRWDEILGDSDPELVSFWQSISVNVPPRLNRGKLTHIQHPALRYFALFLARGFLARDNSLACTSPIVYLLKCAKEGRSCEYNLGVILARTLHFAVRNNEHGTPIFAGLIATLVYEHIKTERHFPKDMGTVVEESNLLNTDLLQCMDMMIWHRNGFLYQYTGVDGQLLSIMPPHTDIFDRDTDKWVVH
jgi:hypothetical protein